MQMIKYIYNFVIIVLSTIFLSLATARAQTPPKVDYRFLEMDVVNTDGKPVADAAVETVGYSHRILQTLQTDQNGRLAKGLPIASGGYDTTVGFKVSKPGYFSYEDIFGTIGGPFSDRSNQPIKLELLIIPKTDAERRAVEDEQRKREFFLAAKNGDFATVRKLLQAGLSANITTTDLRGVPGPKDIPAIVWAAIYGDSEMIIALLAAGADVRNKEKPGHKALLYYLRTNFYLARFPRTKAEAERINPLIIDEDIVHKLIKSGADVKVLSDYGETTLILAARDGTIRMVKTLLDKGVPVNAKDEFGTTALINAVNNFQRTVFIRPGISKRDFRSNSRVAIINLLLNSGADPNLLTYDSNICRSALRSAILGGYLDIIQALIANKANVNLACQDGETALIYAVKNNQVKAVQTLIAAGADVKGKQGQTALMYAKQHQFEGSESYNSNYKEIIKMLEAAGAH